MICAAVVCLCLTAAVFAALFFLFVNINMFAGEEIFMPGLALTFALSGAASFFIYNLLLKLVLGKRDIDEYFDPIEFRLNKPQNNAVHAESN